jgi:hypothetical protein
MNKTFQAIAITFIGLCFFSCANKYNNPWNNPYLDPKLNYRTKEIQCEPNFDYSKIKTIVFLGLISETNSDPIVNRCYEISNRILGKLVENSFYDLVDGSYLDKTVDGKTLSPISVTTPENAAKIGEIFAADALLIGKCSSKREEIRLVSTDTGRILFMKNYEDLWSIYKGILDQGEHHCFFKDDIKAKPFPQTVANDFICKIAPGSQKIGVCDKVKY